jgi:hypothetical protein
MILSDLEEIDHPYVHFDKDLQKKKSKSRRNKQVDFTLLRQHLPHENLGFFVFSTILFIHNFIHFSPDHAFSVVQKHEKRIQR